MGLVEFFGDSMRTVVGAERVISRRGGAIALGVQLKSGKEQRTLLTSLAMSAPISEHLSAACNAPTASFERCCVSGIPNCTPFQPVR